MIIVHRHLLWRRLSAQSGRTKHLRSSLWTKVLKSPLSRRRLPLSTTKHWAPWTRKYGPEVIREARQRRYYKPAPKVSLLTKQNQKASPKKGNNVVKRPSKKHH